MPPLPTGEPVWDLQFDENGQLTSPAQGDFLAGVAAAGVTDLFVFSHGWGASQDAASRLYGQMFPMIRNAAHGLPGLGKLGFAEVPVHRRHAANSVQVQRISALRPGVSCRD